MISDMVSFLRWFDGVNRRAMRDVGTLPAEAETWKPPAAAGGENAWSIGQLVSHMAASRLFFAHAYRLEGWRAEPWPAPTRNREQWITALERSGDRMHALLDGTPDEWLQRRVPGMDDLEQSIAGWRVLMMGMEHDIHHRSQIDTYAGIEGWEVQQIYGRRAEDVGLSPQR
ncbi:MAG: DinB family protein [Candidatus Dormibacteraeota bacterium]|nr:DinB family protein [Candidatus Dormibacteraeota bacterium]